MTGKLSICLAQKQLPHGLFFFLFPVNIGKIIIVQQANNHWVSSSPVGETGGGKQFYKLQGQDTNKIREQC